MVEFLSSLPDSEIVIVDNASTYPPLLEWYSKQDMAKVVRLDRNLGPRSVFDCPREMFLQGVMPPRARQGYFVSSDGDLILDGVPRDVLQVLRNGLEIYPDRCKAGLNEEHTLIRDKHPLSKQVRRHIAQFWSKPLDSFWFDGDIDMTFAMYRCSGGHCLYGPAIRSDRPYVCRQAVWDWLPEELPECERYYLSHLNGDEGKYLSGCTWTPELRERISK